MTSFIISPFNTKDKYMNENVPKSRATAGSDQSLLPSYRWHNQEKKIQEEKKENIRQMWLTI